MEKREVKPKKKAFFFSKLLVPISILFLVLLSFSGFLSMIIYVAFIPYIYLITLGIWAFVFLILLINTSISYKKEKYIFHEHKIVHKSGEIFSDSETELNINKITHVSLKLPFIENKLFGTGKVDIEAAGSGRTEIFLICIDNPEQIYDYVKDIMKNSGFGLTMKEQLLSVKPNLFAAFFETGKTFLGTIFSLFLFGAYFFLEIFSEGIADSQDIKLVVSNLPGFLRIFLFLAIFLGFLGVFVWAILHFLNLAKRRYELYKDTIRYSEGFLTKNYSFVPIENLSDASLSQTFIDKIFGLYDITISCQGTKQEIKFKNIIDGHKFESELDGLIQTTDLKDISQDPEKKVAAKKEEKPHKVLKGFSAKYKQDVKRALVLPIGIAFIIFLFMFLIFIGVFASTGEFSVGDFFSFVVITAVISFIMLIFLIPTFLIKATFTKYELTQESVKEKFDFITSKHREFSFDKITGIVITESIVDKLFKTVSIDFWSIGSSEHVTFTFVRKTEELYNNVLKISGMEDEEKLYSVQSEFSLPRLFKAGLIPFIFALFYVFVSLLLIFISGWFVILSVLNFFFLFLIYLFKKFHFKNAYVEFYEDYIKCERGWLIRSQHYTHYKHIQDIKTVKYPLTSFGKVILNVSGHHGPAQKSKTAATTNNATMSNTISLEYVSDIRKKHTLFDLILYDVKYAKHSEKILWDIKRYEQKPSMKAKQSAANSLFITILITIFTLFGLPFLLIIIPIVIIYINSKKYSLSSYRVFMDYGVIYKKKISVLFKKIDHLNKDRNFLNKMFNNGSITVNTRGSNKPELVVKDIKEYDAFFGELEESYSN